MHEEFDRKSTNNIKASNEKKSRFEYNNVLPINQTFGSIIWCNPRNKSKMMKKIRSKNSILEIKF